MIDKNGRLFGKINIVDLIIIIAVVALGAFAAVKFLGNDAVSGEKTYVDISFFHEEAQNFVVDQIEVGAPVWDYSSDVQLGNLISFETGESISYVLNEEGTSVIAPMETYSSVTLTTRVEGIITSHGVEVGGTLYGVGHTLIMYVGPAKLQIVVSDIQPAS